MTDVQFYVLTGIGLVIVVLLYVILTKLFLIHNSIAIVDRHIVSRDRDRE